MRLSLTKYVNTTLTIRIVPLTVSPLYLWLLVHRVSSTVNLFSFYFCRVIGKLTTFLHLQEFILRNPTHSTITVTRCSPHISCPKWVTSLSRNLVSIVRCSSPPHNPVYVSRVDPSGLVFSLSLHRQSFISILISFRFISS